MGGYLSSVSVEGEVGVFTIWSRQSSKQDQNHMALLIRFCYVACVNSEEEMRLYLVLFI